MSEFTPKQQRFIEEYCVDLNATQAAIRAGYAPNDADVQGPRLLGNVGIAQAVEEHKAKLAERTALSAEKITKDIITIKNRCMQSEPVYDRRGNRVYIENQETGEEECAAYVFDSKGALKAAELLGKRIGMFPEGGAQMQGEAGGPITILRIEIVGIEPRQPNEPPQIPPPTT